jgi:hypothetical protein
MDFNKILFKPAQEQILVDQVIAEVQANYHGYENVFYFIKLERCENETSQIIWVKSFTDPKEYTDFVLDTKFRRACILVKFHKNERHVLLQGFFLSNEFDVRPDSVKVGRPIIGSGDVENIPMTPREILEGAYAEFQGLISTSKGGMSH